MLESDYFKMEISRKDLLEILFGQTGKNYQIYLNSCVGESYSQNIFSHCKSFSSYFFILDTIHKICDKNIQKVKDNEIKFEYASKVIKQKSKEIDELKLTVFDILSDDKKDITQNIISKQCTQYSNLIQDLSMFLDIKNMGASTPNLLPKNYVIGGAINIFTLTFDFIKNKYNEYY
jgi:hypothetical protein